jgi:hypothetical protein
MNSLLAFSTENRNNKFDFWKDVTGTFGTVVYRALKEKNINPEKDVYIDGKQRIVWYKGRKRTIKGTFNAVNIVNFCLEVDKRESEKIK